MATAQVILEWLAKTHWTAAHDGAECPQEHVPKPADIVAHEVDGDTWRVARDDLNKLQIAVSELRHVPGSEVHDALLAGFPIPRTPDDYEALAPPGFAHLLEKAWDAWHFALDGGWDVRFFYQPIVAAWQKRPELIEHETRKDKRILQKIEFGQPHADRERGMVFGGLTDGREPQRELPLFPALSDRNRVPILELVDTVGLPIMSRGHGAPLELRFAVRSLLSMKPHDRHKLVVRVAMTLGELIAGLYPRGWQRRHQWAPLRAMLLSVRDYGIPIDGGTAVWFPWAVRRLPREHAPSLDELVVVDLAPPPGASEGPEIHLPTLDLLGLESAPKYRAYIAAHSLNWRKGVTRIPVDKDRDQWRWVRAPAKYPVITHTERRRLAFGDNDRRNRTEAEVGKAFEDLPGLVVVDRAATDPVDGVIGWRILPATATEEK